MNVFLEKFDFSSLEKNDVLLLRSDERWTAPKMECLSKVLKNRIPKGVTLIFMKSGISINELTEHDMNLAGWFRK